MNTKEIAHYLATNPDTLVRAVRDGIVQADLKINGIPLISEAVASDNLELLSALIDRGADVNAYASLPAAERGMAPIHFAKSPTVVAALAKAGAHIDAPYKDVPHAWGMPGETALHSSLLGQSAEHLQLSEALLKAGANPGLPYSSQEFKYGRNSIQSMSERVIRKGTTIATRLESQRNTFGQGAMHQPEITHPGPSATSAADNASPSAARSVEGRVMAFGFDDEQATDIFYVEIETADGRQKYLANGPLVPSFEDNKVDIGEVIEVQLDVNGHIGSVQVNRIETNEREPARTEPPYVHSSGDDNTARRQDGATSDDAIPTTIAALPSSQAVSVSQDPTIAPPDPAGAAEVRRLCRIETQAADVARFIEMNIGHEAWRVESEVRRSPSTLKALLGSKGRMAALAPYIADKTKHLDPLHVLEISATIASTLRRADYKDIAVAVANARGNKLARPPRPQTGPELQPLTSVNAATVSVSTAPHEHTPLEIENETTSATRPILLTRNGIVPARDGDYNDFDDALAKKKVLDEMSYKVRADGTVLYQVAGADAFVDHGDQLLMVNGADKQERAILGALLLAKEKYGGAFELTGDAAFKNTALDIIVKYRLDVRLRNPEQDAMMRDMLAATGSTNFPAATPQHPAEPIDFPQNESPVSTPAPAPSPQAAEITAQMPAPQASTPPIAEEVLDGTLVSLGRAPYQHIPDNQTSYFMEIQSSTGGRSVAWGSELDPATIGLDLRNGDHIHLSRPPHGENRRWKVDGMLEQRFERSNAATAACLDDTELRVSNAQNIQTAPASQPSKKKAGTEHAVTVKEKERKKTEGFKGKVVNYGRAPYQFDEDNLENYFATLQQGDGHELTIWGKELERAIGAAAVDIGDVIALKHAGKTAVTVKQHERDLAGQLVEVGEINTHRNAWDIKILNKATSLDRYADTPPGGARLSAVSAEQAVQVAPDEHPINRLEGTLLRHGNAPYKNTLGGKPNYFVELRNSDGKQHTAWGTDLARAIRASGAAEGEHVILQNLGRRAVQVDKPDLGRNGNIRGIVKGVSYRNQWEVEVKDRAHKPSNSVASTEREQTGSIVIRPAAWWERQISYIQRYVGDSPDLLKQVDRLGPLSAPELVSYVDEEGHTRNANYKDGLKDLWGPARGLVPGMMTPVVTGGSLGGHPLTPSLSLTRGGEEYLQGLAQVGPTIKHVVVLLQTKPHDPSPGVLPVLAATSTEAGTTWSPVGYGLALPANESGKDGEHGMLRFELGRQIIDAKVTLAPNDGLRRQLGLTSTMVPLPEQVSNMRQQTWTANVQAAR
ncbi:LPD7 domain-containing protein [Rugamonas apoptosis]|uniref:Large polyvalent protein-associated domain-containing protein n=1 Tax=Rugamonas apoptosis TaxID=2758570 RepID=A0A7W2FF42_9BURK|nr:LPD7 domain-containing protein [Rugamonas apoptosis]MBA5690535.1 hypothetical protein [Rugamonas apoptosis]